MYYTSCEMLIDDLKHNKSQIHNINVKRKMIEYPPLTLEELASDSHTDDVSLDLEYNEELSSSASEFFTEFIQNKE